MEEFHKRYLTTCREHQVLPLEAVLHHIQSHFNGSLPADGEPHSMSNLNLSSYNLTPEDCHALASTLTDDLFFEELNFADCLLSEDSSKFLLLGLMDNRAIKRLNLKGNNIRSGAAEILGEFLKRNTCVRSLLVEWNSLGLWDNGMRAVCEGLALNQVLMFLDVRNNQITHEGASQIATALKRNQCLRGLDMRWNNIGLLGGRELLEALKYNKSLVGLELTGNNIPQDIVKAVSVAIQQSSDRQAAHEEHRIKTEVLTRELEMEQEHKRQEVLNLKEEIDRQKSTQEQLNRSTQLKIDHLKTALEDRKSAFDALSARLSTTESELLLARKNNSDQKIQMNSLITELQEERESKASMDLQHKKKINEVLGRNQELENIINTLERKNKSLESKVHTLEEDVEDIANQFAEKGKASDLKFQEDLLSTESRLQREMESLQRKASEYRDITRERILKLEGQRNMLEEEVSGLKNQLVASKLKGDEELMSTKSRLKQEEISRSRQYDEQISQLQTSRDELQIQNTKHLTYITDLQSQLNAVNRDNELSKRQLESLKEQLERRDTDYRNEVNRSRLEIDSERKSQAELRDRISDLESKISEITRRHRDVLSTKDNQLEELNEQLKSRENDIKRIHEEETKRAELLEKAIYSYVSSTKNASRPSSPFRT